MENLLKDFDVPAKNSSAEALFRWRSAVAIVKNPRRRFRMVADLVKRQEAEKKKRSIQEKLRVALFVQKAALQFIEAGGHPEYKLSEEAKDAGFGIDADELSAVVHGHDFRKLKDHSGVHGIAGKLLVGVDTGIKAASLDSRHTLYGSNTFTEKPYRSFLTFVWEALQDLTLIILIVCAGVSVGVGIATEGWPSGVYDGLGIALSVILVVLVTAISDYRQSLQFQELDREKKKISVHVTRDGHREKVSIYDIVVGDLVHLSIGDQVPADGLFVSGHSLLVDESSLSGEVDPVNVDDRRPFLLSGTKVQDGSGKMMITAVGMRTEWGKLMETLSEGGQDETPLQVKLNGVATIIGKIGLVFAVLTFVVLAGRLVVGKLARHAWTDWSSGDAVELLNYFAVAVTIIVVAVPEGLPLAVTLSLAFAMKKLMDKMALVRQLSACETMGSATCICTDKTGTLTTNRMTVTRLTISQKETHLLSSTVNIDIPEPLLALLLEAIFLNTAAEVADDAQGRRSVLGSPTESALLDLGLRLGGDPAVYRRDFTILKVEPFNSVRKKMATLVTLPGGAGGVRAFCKGAAEIVVRLCDKVVGAGGEVAEMTEEEVRRVGRIIDGFASDALRTLCLAYRDVDGPDDAIPEGGYTLLGVVGIKDPVRPGVKEAVSMCLRAGIVVRMVTGDNINTARAIAKECGILTEGGLAIEGKELRGKTDEQLREFIPRIQVMARSLPSDKHILVTKLKNLFGEVVAVTGDGTNDAPALHEADIGLAMGIAGTEVAKENADVIVLDDNFSTIVSVAWWGRAVYINIQKFVQFQLTVNIVALIINFASACILGSAPLTAVQLLWVNMIMDTLGALALATEPPNEGLMRRKPVRKGVDFITPAMWRNIIGQAAYQLVVLGALTFSGETILRLKGHRDVLNTFIFNTFVFCQLFNEINSRDIDKVNVFKGMFNSPIFGAILISTALFQAVIVEILGRFSSTVPLGYRLWLLSIAVGSVSLPVGALLKLVPVRINSPRYHDGYKQLPSGPELA